MNNVGVCVGVAYEDCPELLPPNATMTLRVSSSTSYYAAAYCVPDVTCTGGAYEVWADNTTGVRLWPSTVSVLSPGLTHAPTTAPTQPPTRTPTTSSAAEAAASTVSATVAAAAASATASGSANAGLGGSSPGQSLSDAAGLLEALQGLRTRSM